MPSRVIALQPYLITRKIAIKKPSSLFAHSVGDKEKCITLTPLHCSCRGATYCHLVICQCVIFFCFSLVLVQLHTTAILIKTLDFTYKDLTQGPVNMYRVTSVDFRRLLFLVLIHLNMLKQVPNPLLGLAQPQPQPQFQPQLNN